MFDVHFKDVQINTTLANLLKWQTIVIDRFDNSHTHVDSLVYNRKTMCSVAPRLAKVAMGTISNEGQRRLKGK